MTNEQKTRQVGSRKRTLNIIFFVDSSRTRSVQVSLRSFQIFLGLVIGFVVLSLAASATMVFLAAKNYHLDDRLHATLDLLFDYETRYDRVYEQAYPERKADALAAIEDEDTLETHGNNEVDAQAATPGDVKEPSLDSAATKGDGNVKAQLPKAVVDIVDPTVSLEGTALKIGFKISNLDPSVKAAGLVWTVVEFLDDSNKTSYLPKPNSMKVSKNGEAIDDSVGFKFRIKRFKNHEVLYPSLGEKPGKVKQVIVGLKVEGMPVKIYKVESDFDYAPKEQAQETGGNDASKQAEEGAKATQASLQPNEAARTQESQLSKAKTVEAKASQIGVPDVGLGSSPKAVEVESAKANNIN